MNDVIFKAVMVVTGALILYSIGVITEQRRKKISKRVLVFLSGGIIFDISSTALMIAGSTNEPFTFHGVLGYSALLLMLIDAVLVWRFYLRYREGSLPRNLHLYTRFAYAWWVIAYIVGALMSTVLA